MTDLLEADCEIGSTVAGSPAEEADDYRGIVVQLNASWRVIRCRAGHQWIIQRRRSGGDRVASRWMSTSYHRSRDTLIVAATRRCGELSTMPSSSIGCT